MSDSDAPQTLRKAPPRDFVGRYREIVSDPLNLFIHRVPEAGYVKDGLVTLHNGHRVAWRGGESYYNAFSDILVINRGVHEPLEEFAFQEMLRHLPEAPVMIELGAYWAHYSMWCKQARPRARCIMVEPEPAQLDVGRANFARHGYAGEFREGMIGDGHLTVDAILDDFGIDRLDVLHSDIQGFEGEMLAGAAGALAAGRIDRVFVSTHGQKIHGEVLSTLKGHGYRIDAMSGPAMHSTGHDGLVLAVRPEVARFVPRMDFKGRAEIAMASPDDLAAYVQEVAGALRAIRQDPGRTSRQTA